MKSFSQPFIQYHSLNMFPCHDSSSSFGNSSMTSFLSALLEEENVTSVVIATDNAKPGLESILSLRLVGDEPKCRWNNLVRDASDSDLMKRTRQKSTRPLLSTAAGDKCQLRRRHPSDPNLIQMPMRTISPHESSKPKLSISSIRPSAASLSDSDLLRMPKRLPSPRKVQQRKRSSLNASWDTTPAGDKNMTPTNIFLEILMEPID
jgi:hypothetical protein